MKNKKFKPLSINEQVIVITGATSGIGLETAKLAASLGAKVVMCARNLDELINVQDEINRKGQIAVAVQADVAEFLELKRVADEALRRFGKIDTWVNNAGVSIYGRLIDLREDEERKLFETNFWGLRHGCRIAVDAMKIFGGVIINLGSEASAKAIPLQGIYSASKHAIKAYTDALRTELRHDDIPIAVSLIRPTAINTPYTEHAANRLERGAPSLPSPIYDPILVAKAIIKCAVKPKRDAYVGANSRLATLMEGIAPGFSDRMYEKKLYREQVRGTGVPHTRQNEGLHHAPEEEGKARGSHIGSRVRGNKKNSLDQSSHPQ